MLDRLIRFAAMIDPITPVATWLINRRNSPSVRYNIWVHAGWSALAIKQLLNTGGIRIWGLAIYGDIITFRLRASQARYAQYLLSHAGIPYSGGITVNSPAYRQTRRQSPSKSRQQIATSHSLYEKVNRTLRWR